MSSSEKPPATVEQFLQHLTQEYDGLSNRLKVIARHVETHRDQLGLEGIQSLAEACGVQPSAVVRFAKHFGFSGFSEMQRLFREGLAQQIAPGRAYNLRLRDVIESGSSSLQMCAIASHSRSVSSWSSVRTWIEKASVCGKIGPPLSPI